MFLFLFLAPQIDYELAQEETHVKLNSTLYIEVDYTGIPKPTVNKKPHLLNLIVNICFRDVIIVLSDHVVSRRSGSGGECAFDDRGQR